MNTPRIQFGSSEKTQVIDDKTKMVATTAYHNGKGISTNRYVIRERIPTSRPTIAEMEKLLHDLFYNPDKINPSISIESHANSNGTAYDLVISYTVLQVE